MDEAKLAKVIIDDIEVLVPTGINLIQACEIAGVEIPRFCYHERLKIAGNCRMCLVEILNPKMPPKPVASCAIDVSDGMIVSTKSEMVKKAREGVMEFLLINHPLDCPECDQGGECDLQDQAYSYGKDRSYYKEKRRIVEDKNMGVLIRTNMTRCIHCTRCVRFMEDIAGTTEIGTFGRGEHMEIATFLEQTINSELSGNIIDLCPVGALTSKPFSYTARSWELKKTDTIDIMDAVGSNIRIDSRGFEVIRVLPRINDEINEEWISDVARFSYDGLKYQRIDSAYVDANSVSIDFAINKSKELLTSVKSEQIAVLVGDLVDVETAFMTKKLIDKMGISNYECRIDGAKIDVTNRNNYLFNSGIANIPKADLILLVGTNPRLEAAIINSKIRQAFLNGTQIFSIGDAGDLHYKYKILDNNALFEIYNDKHQICNLLKVAKNPLMILGQQAILTNEGDDIMQLCLQLGKKYFIKNDWNGYNMLHRVAGRVGALDAGLAGEGIDNILNNKNIKVVLAIGCDEINVQQLKDKSVIYVGTHGEELAQMAKIILPSCCYSEKEAFFINTEGSIQKTQQAVPKIGDSMNDWEIIARLIDENISRHEIVNMIKYPQIKNDLEISSSIKECQVPALNNDIKNLYMSNVISRASAIMAKRINELT